MASTKHQTITTMMNHSSIQFIGLQAPFQWRGLRTERIVTLQA
ncbi:hypothetical protein QUF58_01230 [Anaerolineales bacterium HSG24]|nr:hypothetical protein [Anaerolineales bacterium HSG24]